jgi:hypothetical protein
VVLLPSDYNPQSSDTKDDQITIGFSNGRVLNFDISRMSLNSIFKHLV